MFFSKRNGYIEEENGLQKESLSKGLRIALWNASYRWMCSLRSEAGVSTFDLNEKQRKKYFRRSDRDVFLLEVLEKFFEREVDTYVPDREWAEIKYVHTDGEWFRVLDILELIASFKHMKTSIFIDQCNEAFEEKNSVYRFIGDKIGVTMGEVEDSEVKQALAIEEDEFLGVKTSLKKSANFLWNRKKPDYANSMKESISAVESACAVLVGNDTKPLKKVSELLNLHPALGKAILNLYGWTCDEKGVRHFSEKGEFQVSFNNAKFLLIVSSAFIKLLIAEHKVS